jgi:4,5-dihydroxyphthalate decarboxylase
MATGTIRLTVATKDYDHTRDVAYGLVPIEGVDPIWLHLPVEEIFHRFFVYREFDVSEVSMAKYCSSVASGDTSITAIPVFPTRIFRHSSIWVRTDSAVNDPTDLTGRRVGVPEWAQTAGIYIRGMMAHEYGVDLRSIDWFQGGVNQAGRREHAAFPPPPGIRITPVPDRSLNDMLLDGDLDAILSARPPHGSHRDDGRVRRLFADPETVEKRYYARTGIFPIMHTIAVKQELVDQHGWLPMALFKAFSAARANSVQRMLDGATPRVPLPWIRYDTERTVSEFDGDPWPYGTEPNRTTLTAYLEYAFEQGVCARQLSPEDLFAKQIDEGFRI